MDTLDQLEQRVEQLLRRAKELEDENTMLKARLEEEQSGREAVRERIDRLLSRLQDDGMSLG